MPNIVNKHILNMIASIWQKLESGVTSPIDQNLVQRATIGHNRSVLARRNHNGILNAGENDLKSVVGQNGFDGVGEMRRVGGTRQRYTVQSHGRQPVTLIGNDIQREWIAIRDLRPRSNCTTRIIINYNRVI